MIRMVIRWASMMLIFNTGTAAAQVAEADAPTAGLGKISGVIVDAKSGEPLIEAQVTVAQTGKKVLTDIDGNYEVQVPPGVYDLRVFSELRQIRRITKIVVEAGKTTTIDVKLGEGEEQIAVQEVVVIARPDTATEAVQVLRRRKSAVVQDGVSAEQISRTPDSNAGEAVKRVVAATIQDNKYIVVRGLGGRYSNTLLNGVALPSTDPDNPSVPLDLFPAGLLANLTIAKTFNADIPGNFAGGSLQIETREFPAKFTLKLRVSASGDTATTFTDTLASKGGALDFLGYDDGTRSLPDGVPEDRSLVVTQDFTQQQANQVGGQFPSDWNTKQSSAVPNPGLAGTVGDTLSLGSGRRLGYLGTLSYGHRWTHRDITSRTLFTDAVRETFDTDWGRESATLGGLVNLGLSLSPTQRLGLVSLYSHSNDNTVQVVEGNVDSLNNAIGRRTRIDFIERSLSFNQLTGEHQLGSRVNLVWQGNVALARQEQPDLRDTLYLKGADEIFRFQSLPQSGERLYSDLSDLSGGGGVDVWVTIAQGLRLKVGGLVNVATRNFDARRFRLSATEMVTSEMLAQSPNELFRADNVGTYFNFREETRIDDSYDFRRNVYSAYVLGDVARFDPLRFVAGARVEAASQHLEAGTKFSNPPSMLLLPDRDEVDVLPAINVIYSLSESMNLRASYGLTLARPQIRELAPFRFYDVTRNRTFSGNPELKTTKIHNADLRWEWFPAGSDLFAASLFYKRFIDPIETALLTDQGDFGFVNADGADTFGGELEVRLSGSRLAAALKHLRLSGNLSVIYSKIRFDPDDPALVNQTNRERPLQGQSPYVANVELGYDIGATRTDVSLLYNVFGPRIAEVGAFLLPDVKEEPLHRLDLAVTQVLPGSLVLKLAGTNLGNQKVRYRQGSTEVLAYKLGVSVSASLEWSL